MNCRDIIMHLNAYIDNEIDPGICDQLREHMHECEPCRLVVDTTKNVVILYRGQSSMEIPVTFHNRLHAVLFQRWQEKFAT